MSLSKQVEGIALRCPRPGGRNAWEKTLAVRFIFRRLTLRSAPGTPQRGDPYRSKTGGEGTCAGVHSGCFPVPRFVQMTGTKLIFARFRTFSARFATFWLPRPTDDRICPLFKKVELIADQPKKIKLQFIQKNNPRSCARVRTHLIPGNSDVLMSGLGHRSPILWRRGERQRGFESRAV